MYPNQTAIKSAIHYDLILNLSEVFLLEILHTIKKPPKVDWGS